MTGRTHDLAAFTALNITFLYFPLTQMSLATCVVAFAANFIGGLIPDLDQNTSSLWKKIRGGSLIAPFITPLMGGHRTISHSLVGFLLLGFLADKFLYAASSIILVDMTIVWLSFMIGLASHLVADAVTKEGIPFFFPLPFTFGIPPFESLRMTTGKLVEKSFVYPGLMLLNGYWFFTNSDKYLDFIRNYIG